ncbi:MAG: hypothetical protein Q7S28_02420 [bacterium]|nr:hypothetical protein [bacterium]
MNEENQEQKMSPSNEEPLNVGAGSNSFFERDGKLFMRTGFPGSNVTGIKEVVGNKLSPEEINQFLDSQIEERQNKIETLKKEIEGFEAEKGSL